LICLASKYWRKTLTAVLVAFLCFLRYFLQVSKTITHFPKVQQSEPPLFTKIEGNAHAQTIICG
jgi:hypothetical protein